jgi:tRNA-splicing ligase RtcB
VNLKSLCRPVGGGCYLLEEGVRVPVRIFMNETLFAEAEEALFQQIKNATEFPDVRDVVITPDAHTGYVVPVGCVIATEHTLCQAPVGYDIGCGMMAFRSNVDKGKGLDDRLRRRFSEEVMDRVALGVGEGGKYPVDSNKFEEIVRFGAQALGYERGHASERDFIPVDDRWTIPAKPKSRGIHQLRSLGGGNHFIELQYDQEEHLWVMVHTGSRGFGHGMATEYIQRGKEYLRQKGIKLAGGAEATYFSPDSPLWFEYKNAVAAGANFAIANRLLIWEGVGRAFRKVFGSEPELVYEISHNLVQEEEVPALGGKFWVHRKGATRAFPARHPMLKGTRWYETGHPILIPGSMGDKSYILYAEPGAERSLYSVNHGCGRRMSRSAAKQQFTQAFVNKQMATLNVMVNAGGNVPIDESPGCYKPAEDVIASVVGAGLARVAYVLTPIASIKGND